MVRVVSIFWILVSHLLVTSAPNAQQVPSGDPVVAKAGDVFITEQEFLERFELTPGLYRHGKTRLEGEKAYFLHSMIAEKLLAQEAMARTLDRDTLYQLAMGELTKLLARDQLYRMEVKSKVDVPPEEIQRGMAQAVKERLVTFLYFPSDRDAEFVRRQMKNPSDFDRVRIDSSMGVIRDTATVIWGEADTLIEAAAYRLAPGEISPVVRTGRGCYILRLTSSQSSKLYGILSPDVLRERVSLKIRDRKERARALEYARQVLRDKAGYSPPVTFKRFAERVTEVFAKPTTPPRTAMSREMLKELLQGSAGELNDTLIVAGPKVWTVHDAISRLYVKSFGIERGTVRSIPRRLYEFFEEWVHQELIAQEALRRGLDRLPEVQRQVEPWRDQYLANAMRRHIDNVVPVSDREALAYMQQQDSRFTPPQVQLRILHTRTLAEMSDALVDLESGASLEDVAGRWNSDSLARRNGGRTAFFPVTERPLLGELAWNMNVGERYGPIQDSTGVLFFEVLAKKDSALRADTSFAARFSEAKKEVLRLKQKRTVTLFIAQAAARRGFTVYEDRLQKLSVTPIPMLAFRLLGFGGRMFAVPFVDRQVQWIDVEAPEGTIVP